MVLESKTAEPMVFKWNPQAPEFVPQTQTDKNEYLAKQLMELLKEVPQVQMPVTVQNPIPVPQTISRDKKLLKIDAIEVRCGEADMKLQAMSDANDQFREEMGLKILEMEKLDDYEDDEYDSDLYDDDGYMQWASKFTSLSSSSSSSLSVDDGKFKISCDHVQVSAKTVSFD